MNDNAITHIGPWSEMKIQIVRDYADAYSKIMKEQGHWLKSYAYIDGFAGAGRHRSRKTGEMVDGSPTAVLRVEPPFPAYHFVELDPERAAALKGLTCQTPGQITVHHGEANAVLLNEVLPKYQRDLFTRALLLLDPYNIGIDWQVTRAVGHSKAIDLFFNFMVMDANMNALHLDPTTVTHEQAARMTRFWGDDSWKTTMYRPAQDTLPGFEIVEKQTNDVLAQAFASRLSYVAGFEFVAKPLPVRNEAGKVVYYLYYASHNKTGLKIANSIFDSWRK